MRIAHISFLALVLLPLVSCERAVTQVVVYLDAEPASRAVGVSVRVRITSLEGEVRRDQTVRVIEPNADTTFPLRVPVSPSSGDAARGWILDAWLLSETGETVAQQHAQGRYIAGEQRKVWLVFDDACLADPCIEAGRACVRGACAQACVEPVPLDAPDTPTPHVACEPCAGCWRGFECVEGNTLDACGRDGETCEACPCAGDACDLGVCHPELEADVVSAGFDHTCARVGGVTLACWGDNTRGQLGLADRDNRDVPVLLPAAEWQPPRAGIQFTCATQGSGRTFCWGLNDETQLGQADFANRDQPTEVGPIFGTLAVGARHACGIDAESRVFCWGHDEGQLGQGGELTGPVVQPSPLPVLTDVRFRNVSAGDAHTCAIASDGSLFCWGRACCGELGIGPSTRQTVPRQVGAPNEGTERGWTDLGAGRYHQCALQDGLLYCWGGNFNLQLGLGGVVGDVDMPARVGAFDDWTRVAAGRTHTCAIRADGSLYCFGGNDRGQLGLGMRSEADVADPEPLASRGWAAVSVGELHTCAIRAGGTVYCWGANGTDLPDGRLGVGDGEDRDVPTRVCFPPP